MTAVKTRPLILAVIVGACVLAGILVFEWKSGSDVYRGKTLTIWLFQLSASDPKARAQAEAAFAALGTNAIPELTRLVEADDFFLRKLVWEHAGGLPRRTRASLLQRIGPTNACMIRPMAAQALAKFGPAAGSAVPALAQMLRNGTSAYEQMSAAQSLAHIGGPALAALTDVMAHGNYSSGNAAAIALLGPYRWPRAGETQPGETPVPARLQAVETLAASSKDDELLVKVLGRATVDPDPGVRLAALKGLARANRNPQFALPYFLSCANDKSPQIREWSARIIGRIRPPVGPVIPALRDLAQDNEESVRVVAAAALEAINAAGDTNTLTAPQ